MIIQRAPGWVMRTTQRCVFAAQCLQLTCFISVQIAVQQRRWHWRSWTTCSIGRSRPCQISLGRANMARSSWTRSWSMAFAVSPDIITVFWQKWIIDSCISLMPPASPCDRFPTKQKQNMTSQFIKSVFLCISSLHLETLSSLRGKSWKNYALELTFCCCTPQLLSSVSDSELLELASLWWLDLLKMTHNQLPKQCLVTSVYFMIITYFCII